MDLSELMLVLQKYPGHDYKKVQAVMNDRPKAPRWAFISGILPTRPGYATQSLSYTDFIAIFDRDHRDRIKSFCATSPVYLDSKIGLDIDSEDVLVVEGYTPKSLGYSLMENLGEAIAKTEGSSFEDIKLRYPLILLHKYGIATHIFSASPSESIEPESVVDSIRRVVDSKARFEKVIIAEYGQMEIDRLRQVERIREYIQSASLVPAQP